MGNDYIMRQIEDITRLIAHAIFMRQRSDFDIIDEHGEVSSGQFLLYRLRKLAYSGQINEAENLLFETIDREKRDEYLAAALDFYETLGAMTDEQLLAADFSREEVLQGLKEVKNRYDM